jgi:hypothetical protein
METDLLIVIVIAAVALAGIWLYMKQRRREHLRERFGPEYERAVTTHGHPARAEAELEARERRVEKLHIRPLPPQDRTRFSEAWSRVQGLFVDAPRDAVTQADQLVDQVMTARGYPVADFEQRAADVSVDHPRVVEHYRAARVIAASHGRGEASTEDLRQALIHYRELFADLLEAPHTHPERVRRVG